MNCTRPRYEHSLILLALVATSVALAQGTDEKPTAEDAVAAKAALAPFNDYVGAWRGVGQPKRGSRDGAWLESAEWVWEFQPQTAVKLTVDDGKQLQSGRLLWDAKAKEFRFEAELPDKSKRTYRGTLDDGKLVLTSPVDAEGMFHRVTVRLLSEKRLVVLLENRRESQTFFTRVAEVGYTRKGTTLAAGGTGPECVVTGGKGTIEVSFKGQTYYVCCTGCKQAFDDDPEGILADYRQRKAAEKK